MAFRAALKIQEVADKATDLASTGQEMAATTEEVSAATQQISAVMQKVRDGSLENIEQINAVDELSSEVMRTLNPGPVGSRFDSIN